MRRIVAADVKNAIGRQLCWTPARFSGGNAHDAGQFTLRGWPNVRSARLHVAVGRYDPHEVRHSGKTRIHEGAVTRSAVLASVRVGLAYVRFSGIACSGPRREAPLS